MVVHTHIIPRLIRFVKWVYTFFYKKTVGGKAVAIKKTRNDDILDRIIEKMNEQHVTQTQLANRLGLNRCVFNTWKSNRSRTYLKYIDQIAEYLGVPYDYLLTGSSIQDVVALTSAERELVLTFRTLDPGQKKLLSKIAETIQSCSDQQLSVP